MRIVAVSNGLWNALATAVSTVVGLVGSVLIVRGLTPDDYGLFSYYVWLGTIIGLLGTLAAPIAITKLTSELRGRNRDDQAHALSSALLLVLVVLNFAFTTALLLFALIVAEPHRTILVLLAAMLMPHAMAAVLRSTLWGRERYAPASIVSVVASGAQFCLIATAYYLDLGTSSYVAALFSAHFTQAIGLSIVLWRNRHDRRSLPSDLRLEASVRRQYIAFLVPASLLLLLDIPRQRAGILVLERLRDLNDVGYFNLSYTIYASLLAMGVAVISAYNPALSRDFGARDWDQIRMKVPHGLALAALVVVPLTFGMWATLDRVVDLFYGEKMLSAIPVSQILVAGLLPGVVIAMLTFTLTALGRVWIAVRAGVLLSPIAAVLLLILVPPFGAVGAAGAVVIAQLAYAGVLGAIVWRTYGISVPVGPLLRTAAIGGMATYVVPIIIQSWITGLGGLAVAIIAGAGCYAALMWMFGQVQPFLGDGQPIRQQTLRERSRLI